MQLTFNLVLLTLALTYGSAIVSALPFDVYPDESMLPTLSSQQTTKPKPVHLPKKSRFAAKPSPKEQTWYQAAKPEDKEKAIRNKTDPYHKVAVHHWQIDSVKNPKATKTKDGNENSVIWAIPHAEKKRKEKQKEIQQSKKEKERLTDIQDLPFGKPEEEKQLPPLPNEKTNCVKKLFSCIFRKKSNASPNTSLGKPLPPLPPGATVSPDTSRKKTNIFKKFFSGGWVRKKSNASPNTSIPPDATANLPNTSETNPLRRANTM